MFHEIILITRVQIESHTVCTSNDVPFVKKRFPAKLLKISFERFRSISTNLKKGHVFGLFKLT